MDVITGMAGEARELQYARCKDDRRREEEREVRSIFMIEPAEQSTDERDARS